MEWLRWYHGTITDPKWKPVAANESLQRVIQAYKAATEKDVPS